jgi:hypothetical protein
MPVVRSNRRTFIAGLGGVAAWPVVARGQQTRKSIRLGFLGPTRNNPPIINCSSMTNALRRDRSHSSAPMAVKYFHTTERGPTPIR